MLEVLPFVEDPDLSGSAAPALPQLLPPWIEEWVNENLRTPFLSPLCSAMNLFYSCHYLLHFALFSVTSIVQKVKGNFSGEATIQILQIVTQFWQDKMTRVYGSRGGFINTVFKKSTKICFHPIYKKYTIIQRPVFALFSLVPFCSFYFNPFDVELVKCLHAKYFLFYRRWV